MDSLLGARPNVTALENGIDSDVESVEQDTTDDSASKPATPTPEIMPKPIVPVKRRKNPKGKSWLRT